MPKISENLEKCRKNAMNLSRNLEKRRKNAGKGREHARDRSPKRHPKRPETGAE